MEKYKMGENAIDGVLRRVSKLTYLTTKIKLPRLNAGFQLNIQSFEICEASFIYIKEDLDKSLRDGLVSIASRTCKNSASLDITYARNTAPITNIA